MKGEIEKYMIGKTCPVCNGSRLKKEAVSVTIANKSIVEVVRSSVSDALDFFNTLWVNDEQENG